MPVVSWQRLVGCFLGATMGETGFSTMPFVAFVVFIAACFDIALSDPSTVRHRISLRPAIWAVIGSAIGLGIADIAWHLSLADASRDPSPLTYVAMLAPVLSVVRFYRMTERSAIVATVSLAVGTLFSTISSPVSTSWRHNLSCQVFHPVLSCSVSVIVLSLLLGAPPPPMSPPMYRWPSP